MLPRAGRELRELREERSMLGREDHPSERPEPDGEGPSGHEGDGGNGECPREPEAG